jgi:serine phosphatase RsbU (regulator of sigma subunit)/tetratricopeptide (TPR) repeat protein
MRPLEPNAEQHRFYEALAAFFRGLGSLNRPVVMLIDDAQWLDEGSLRVIGRLGSDSNPSPFLLIATSRDGDEHAAALTRVVSTLAPRLAARLSLTPLNFEAIDALITLSLGGSPLDRPTVQRLAALTHGNPFAIGQYMRTLLDQGVIKPAGRQWRADSDALEAVQLPRDVVELVVRRLYGLGEQTARIAGMAAVIGQRFRADLLAEVAGLAPTDLTRTLDELVASGLVERAWGDQFAFVHDRVRESSLERLTDEETRDIHQRAAEALDSRSDRSTTDLFALARHYALGRTEANPARAGEINLEAGLRALEDHANEEAFELLDRAHRFLGMASIDRPMRLLEGLGRACAMTGRLRLAFQHLEEALLRAREKQDRFRLQHLLTLTYASQGRNTEALRGVYKTFEVLGKSFPKWRVTQILSLLGFWMLALVLRWTGIGYGKAQGLERERRKVLSQLHYTGSMVSLFQGDPILMVQFVVRDFYNVHRLGPTPETAVASSLYGAVMGMFSLKSVMTRYTALGVQTAEQLGDRAALAVARAYQAVGHKWAGDLVKGNALLEPALEELHRYTPGSWYAAMMIAEQAYSYLHAGHTLAAIAHCKKNSGQLERTNNLMYKWNTLSVLYAETMLTGDSGAASELLARLEPDYEPLQNTIYVKLAKVIADLEVMTDQEETGPSVDATIALFKSLASEDYYSNAGRMLAGYARLTQFEKAATEDRKAARKLFVRAIWALRIRAIVPVFKCHPLIWRAALARTDGKFDKARKLLNKAEKLAAVCESRRGLFHIALERARLARAEGDGVMTYHAEAAVRVALSEQWRRRARRVRVEFDLAQNRQENVNAATRVATNANTRSAEQTQRYAHALLQVSLASVSTLDVKALAKNALTEVAKVLGAERALFFTIDEETKEPQLEATTGPQAQAISQSVVRRVVETRAPLVLTGTDDGEALASESILTYGLRSILAAPVMLRDRLLGVVYLDSRLAKGIFTPDDVGLLLGVSNHIAIALETARVARSEAERLAMQRDLELVGAMQTLFMPKNARFAIPGLNGVGFYQPASQCGGDWWWYEAQPDGSLLLLLGDVSGHGAGAAMITSAVAGSFLTMRQYLGVADPEAILAELSRRLFAFGNCNMTMAFVKVDPRRRELTLWNAASPGILGITNGTCRSIVAPGKVLGDAGGMDIGRSVVRIEPGDRFLISTDGLYELKDPRGRQLGPRRIAGLMQRLADVSLDDIPAQLGAEIRDNLKDRSQEDDITCVVLEVSDASRSQRIAHHDSHPVQARAG